MYNINVAIPESSSGRTEDSGSSNGGSNPSSGFFYCNFFHIFLGFQNPEKSSTHRKFFVLLKFPWFYFLKVPSSSGLVFLTRR